MALNSSVRMLIIDTRLPTYPGYPSINTLAFVFKEQSRSGELAEFLDFATSAAAAPAIRAAGGMPLTP